MSGVFFLIGRLEVWKNLLTYLTIDFFLYKAFTTFGVENCAFHFLGDGESLVDEAVGQLLHLTLLHCKHEIVSPVVS